MGVATPNLRSEFWREFQRSMASTAIGCSRPSSDGWMWHVAGLTSGYLASLVNVRLGEIGVRYRIMGPNADTVFSVLEDHKARIDSAFDASPVWRRGDGNSHVIEVRGRAHISARASWSSHMSWLREQLESFQAALWPIVGRVPPPGTRRRWDESLFFADLSRWNPACLHPARAILESALDREETISWGTGGRVGSFAPSTARQGVAYRLVSVRTDGAFQLLFARLKDTPLFVDRARRLELLERVNRAPHLRLPDAVVERLPVAPLTALTTPDDSTAFVDALAWFRTAVRS